MKNNQRYKDSLASRMITESSGETIFLLSPSDHGVRRNKGRNGTRFGPQAIMNNFLKLNSHLDKVQKISTLVVSDQKEEEINFHEAQDTQSQKILDAIDLERKNIIHIGGGHDHAKPLLKAINNSQKKYKKILIINIDAHCDTRIDDKSHSGTPFRDFDNETNLQVKLIQFGIHNYSNGPSTLEPLKTIDQEIIFQGQVFKLDESFIDESTFIYLSLDADGLDSSVMRAVSAVNPSGVTIESIENIIEKIKSFNTPRAFGIYEYNPIFDDLSNQGAKVISHLMYKWLE